MATDPPIVLVTPNPAFDMAVHIDQWRPGQHVQARDVDKTAGGKGVNVATVMAHRGQSSTVTGWLGERDQVAWQRELAAHGPGQIDQQWVKVPGSVRCNITILDHATACDTHIRSPGQSVEPVSIAELDALIDRQPRGTIVCICGSLPPGVDEHWLTGRIDHDLRADRRVVIDQDGPMLGHVLKHAAMPSGEQCQSDDTSNRLWIIKPNQSELIDACQLSEDDQPALLRAACSLLEHVQYVALTLGSAGAVLACDRGLWHARYTPLAQGPDSQPAINTVGCGDWFLAGLILALQHEGNPANALRQAVAFGTSRAMHVRCDRHNPQYIAIENHVRVDVLTSASLPSFGGGKRISR